MGFRNMFKKKRSKVVEELATAKSEDVPEEPQLRVENATEPDSVPEKDLDSVLDMYSTIQEIIGDDDQMVVKFPAEILLAAIPADKRGAKWRPGPYDGVTVELERDSLLEKLKRGRVTFSLSELAISLPAGWITVDADEEVELNLSDVVAAVPAQFMCGAGALAPEVREVAEMKDYFKPGSSAPTAPELPVEGVDDVAEAVVPEVEQEAPPEVEPMVIPEEEAPGKIEAEPVATQISLDTGESDLVQEDNVPEEDVVEEEPETSPPIEPEPIILMPEEPPEEPMVRVEEIEIPSVPEVSQSSDPQTEEDMSSEKSMMPSPQVAEWNGVEGMLSAGVQMIDVNTASADELMTLCGVGRQEHREFSSIFELLDIPGVGRGVFESMTGLNSRTRSDRQEVLNNLLEFDVEARPSLTTIISGVVNTMPVAGCVLAGKDGEMLASKNADADAERLAALTVQMFRRSRRYLKRLSGGAVDAIMLPSASPGILLLTMSGFSLILMLESGADWQELLGQSQRVAAEIGWLLGPRAVVRGL